MLYGFLLTLFILASALLILVILIQQGKSSMGLGNLGGGAQMLFGGSGGQDIFQKITWILGAIFIFGSLFLSIMKTHQGRESRYVARTIPQTQTSMPIAQPSEPAEEPQE
ncbi:preprotein translocase subunit SecG [Candidatus Dependentiae bacterium]|nr:preprotein translocase subunit SecG [Candidatus Dependentiae bacterium]MCC7415134.1 preprotein translocase subunit SecG [Campylobacterota bacterium]